VLGSSEISDLVGGPVLSEQDLFSHVMEEDLLRATISAEIQSVLVPLVQDPFSEFERIADFPRSDPRRREWPGFIFGIGSVPGTETTTDSAPPPLFPSELRQELDAWTPLCFFPWHRVPSFFIPPPE